MLKITDLEQFADIPCQKMDPNFPNSAPITIGNSIVCDGYTDDKTVAIFTHFHSDHIVNFSKTLRHCDHILLTQPTFDAIKVLRHSNLNRATIEPMPLSPNKFCTSKGETIELINANHIPGSCQVFVEMEENGIKILYSGDFCYPGLQVRKADVLVLAAEHGTKTHDYHTDKPSILRTIFRDVYSEITKGEAVEIHAHSGSMQDIIEQLEKGVEGKFIPKAVPFLANQKDVELTEALANAYSVPFRKLEEATDNRLNELIEEKKPYVRFAPAATKTEQQDRASKIIQADVNPGFANNGPYFTTDNRTWFACLSPHSSFSNILKYVGEVEPKLVLIDGTRAAKDTAISLARSISEKYQIQAIPKYCSY